MYLSGLSNAVLQLEWRIGKSRKGETLQALSTLDELRGRIEVYGAQSRLKIHHSCRRPGADQSTLHAGRFQRAAVLSLHPQLSCEM